MWLLMVLREMKSRAPISLTESWVGRNVRWRHPRDDFGRQ